MTRQIETIMCNKCLSPLERGVRSEGDIIILYRKQSDEDNLNILFEEIEESESEEDTSGEESLDDNDDDAENDETKSQDDNDIDENESESQLPSSEIGLRGEEIPFKHTSICGYCGELLTHYIRNEIKSGNVNAYRKSDEDLENEEAETYNADDDLESEMDNIEDDRNSSHILQSMKSKARCSECYKEKKKYYGYIVAQNKTPRVDTYCTSCLKYYCQYCFEKLH